MKNFLLYNYNIDVDDIKNEQENVYSFYIDYIKYYLLKINNYTHIEETNEILKQIVNRYHRIVPNKNNEIVTTEKSNKIIEKYILLSINYPENMELDLKDILESQISIKNNSFLKTEPWNKLWSSKVDYLEYQISELGKNHPLVLQSFSYYIGLAENAIEYYNMLNLNNNQNLVLAQKRIKYPNIAKNYYNPINLIVDNRTRDISEYLKSKFFETGNVDEDLSWLISKNILNETEYNLLYARLLYPSYYFDELNNVLEKNISDDALLKYVEKVNGYELFLINAYEKMSTKARLQRIDWLIKK